MTPNPSRSRQSVYLPTVDLSSSPQVDSLLKTKYWLNFLHKYYVVGREKYGPLGSPGAAARTRRIEEEIRQSSMLRGDAPTLDIPEIDARDINPHQFHEIYLHPNTPVVLRGMAKEWPSVSEWDLDFFGEKHGSEMVSTRVRGNELNEEALQYVDMSLSEVVENIRAGGSYYPGHTEDLFNRQPNLREALGLQQLASFLSTRDKRIMSTQLFLSGGGVRSAWHCTGGPNLFTMIHGRKEWTLVHPKHSMWMHPYNRKDMFYAGSFVDWKKSNDENEKDGYPLYRYVPKFRTVLEPGDVLFSPHWWWHCVDTPVPSIGIASRAVNKLIMGNTLFSVMWVTSRRFRRTLRTCLKTGWGSDAATGAKVAFEFDRKEFLRRMSA